MKSRLEEFMENAKAKGCKVINETKPGRSSTIIGFTMPPFNSDKEGKESHINNAVSSFEGMGDAKRPTVSVAWPGFEQNLAATLAVLQEDQYFVLSVKRADPYVQFAAQGAYGLRAETISNHYLPPGQKLNDSQITTLMDLGWMPPTGAPEEATPEKQPDGSPNFFCEFPQPVFYGKVAHFAVRTLVEVFRVHHPGMLEYQALNADKQKILLPTLGLAVRPFQPS